MAGALQIKLLIPGRVIMRWVALLTLLSFSVLADSSCQSRGPNVVLFTWDGVRTREFFKGTGLFHTPQLKRSERGEIFSTFWAQHADQGIVLGKRKGYKIASSIAISLPSYQALMVGHATKCRNNKCGAIQEETVLESIRSNLQLPRKDVAVFASWTKILSAVASDTNQITHGVYPGSLESSLSDSKMDMIQKKAMEDLPNWHESRKDQYTFDLGMHYLKKHCPRVLYLSLVDSDEYGHAKDYPNYVKTLRTYDQYLDQLIKTLEGMGEYGKQTTIIVTTDHSRGAGPLWVGHGITEESEKEVFLYARGRGVKAKGISSRKASHVNIRPTLEYLMGMKPTGEILPHINVD